MENSCFEKQYANKNVLCSYSFDLLTDWLLYYWLPGITIDASASTFSCFQGPLLNSFSLRETS